MPYIVRDDSGAIISILAQPRDEVHRYRRETMEYVAKFGWPTIAPKYDSLIDEMLAATS